jgi:ATP-dependent helicase HrpB
VPPALPVDHYIPEIRETLRRTRAVVVVAAPGAGKTTRIPPALAEDGPVILLQPRRIAARTIARRIAEERGWTVGNEVGWHVRFDRQFSRETRLLVATEGILTARLQQDPLLSEFQTIVLDEFHERSIHADVGLALAKQAWRARDDLRLAIMSATLDAGQVAEYLDGCPIFDIPGTLHPLDVSYRPGQPVHVAVREMLSRTSGQILCFLPGAREVRDAAAEVRANVPSGIEVVELHGSLPADEQDAAMRPSSNRRIVVSTNIAETSLTVPGVSAVVDLGLHKVARYDAERAIDSLELERISKDAADQRAGRAGRLGPGVVFRLWDERDRLRPHREAHIARIDLSGPVLDVLSWGGDPRTFEWFERPTADRLEAALDLLTRLGAVERGALTPIGRRMSTLALHPRLARILIEADGATEAALACAMLSERQVLPPHAATTTCDLLAAMDRDVPPHIRRNARELQRAFGRTDVRSIDERTLRRALLAGYPDRVAQRRNPGDSRVRLATGHGGWIGPESGVRSGEFVLALAVEGGRRGDGSEARIRIASIVERDWLMPTSIERVTGIDESTGMVRAVEREMYDALVLKERPVQPDPSEIAAKLAEAFLSRPLSEGDEQLLRRLRFAGIEADLRRLASAAAYGKRSVHDIVLLDALDWNTRQELDRKAPATFTAPSGRTHRLEYRDDGSVALSIKLQELFGLPETPRIGARQEPLLILLLAPNGRPVQTTRDLRSFWNTTYPEVRKELRGRYPKHPWPEDPWRAVPTARTKRAPDVGTR